MSHVLVFTDQYNRRAARFLKRHPQVREQYRKTLLLLQANPQHPSLRLHALSGRLNGLHSVSINLSYRITLELVIRDRQIVPINVGDHDAVY
ncbi:plasmid stabilization protein [Rhodanobacter sp. B05]|uniref:type II toxin-antitoxin system RelE/ParE family toxin n=1 Tax=Rhodanobacter sp. B05 TaxID=1945859 RepID=UPI000984A0F2|nr:plasmid stabilization protein [Rhodanobacter sp. B05]OOG61063.1 plasmid stabilization protein [Rhodanobacter sp. B05]